MKKKFACVAASAVAMLSASMPVLAEVADTTVRHPMLNTNEMIVMAEKASDYFDEMIKVGKEAEALKEFNRPPMFRMSNQSWKTLKEDLNEEDIEKLSFMKSDNYREFAEYQDLYKDLEPLFGKVERFNIGRIILKHAEEVVTPKWTTGTGFDWRFVLVYNCDKNIIAAHPLLPGFVNKPMLDKLKDNSGNEYVVKLCENLKQNNNAQWSVGNFPILGKEKGESPMWVYMTPVKDTDYQIGVFSRVLDTDDTDIEQLNQLVDSLWN